MDLLSDASASDASSSAPGVDEAEPGEGRLASDVGQRLLRPAFSGPCVGDDMFWKGSKTLRVACLQCGSVGRDRFQWGLWRAQSLSALGAGIVF